jgi:hypothetical protein
MTYGLSLYRMQESKAKYIAMDARQTFRILNSSTVSPSKDQLLSWLMLPKLHLMESK